METGQLTKCPGKEAILPLLILLGLFAWQGWMTLTLFGSDGSFDNILNDKPVVSGFHALHQYHGFLGAQAILASGRCCCYDPSFQAGYPKTPIFDSGSRPAELFMLAAGGGFNPAAYKIGLAILCCSVPFLLIIAARGIGLGWWQTVTATGFGLLIWWGAPSRLALETGDIDLLLGGLLLIAHVGLLLQYDRSPGFFCWLGLLLSGMLGWFSHPLLFPLLFPLLLVYYLSAGVKHKSLAWHIALFLTQIGALAINAFWIYDWIHHWWIRAPLPPSLEMLPHRTIGTIWNAPFWGKPADQAFAVFLVFWGLVGLVIFQVRKLRSAFRVLGIGGFGLMLLAILGISWEPLGKVGTSILLVPCLWFAAISGAYALGNFWRFLMSLSNPAWRWSLAVFLILIGSLSGYSYLKAFAERSAGTEALLIGLSQDRLDIVAEIREHTSRKARILWEDIPGDKKTSRWPVLLPLLTDRIFLGGLDPEGRIEHSHAGFVRHLLARRPMGRWSNSDLHDYCQRYNIGWVVAWSPSTIKRFREWKTGAREITTFRDEKPGVLFKILRDNPTFALHGKATLTEATSHRLTLVDVVPKNGKVVLSFHYQEGLRASPSRVQVEREPDAVDAIPLLRLRLTNPVSRVTLTWDHY